MITKIVAVRKRKEKWSVVGERAQTIEPEILAVRSRTKNYPLVLTLSTLRSV